MRVLWVLAVLAAGCAAPSTPADSPAPTTVAETPTSALQAFNQTLGPFDYAGVMEARAAWAQCFQFSGMVDRIASGHAELHWQTPSGPPDLAFGIGPASSVNTHGRGPSPLRMEITEMAIGADGLFAAFWPAADGPVASVGATLALAFEYEGAPDLAVTAAPCLLLNT